VADRHVRNLIIDGVSKRFATPEGGEVRALDDVSLTVDPGEFIVLLGPSGCGKTTLLRCIAGLEYPDEGTIHLGEERIDTQPAYRRRVNTVFQSYALFPHMSVADNVRFGLDMDGMDRPSAKARVSQMLDLVQLAGYESRRPNQLSGGQQQRVALARALAKGPDVLLLDEPLSALDLKLRRGMQIELKRIQAVTGVTFVFVTHDQDEAMSMGDRIAVFASGAIAQLGRPRDVYERPATRYVADFVGESTFVTATCEGTGADAGYRLPGGGRLAHTELDTGGGPPPSPGSEVLLTVRPEHLVIVDVAGPDETSGQPRITGTVRDVSYAGREVRVTLVAPDGMLVTTRLPARGAAVPDTGQQVTVQFLPHVVRAVAA